MFISHLFAVAVTALATVSIISAAPTAEKDVLVKRGTEDIVLSTLNSLSGGLSVPIGLINTAVANNDVSMATVLGPCDQIITLFTFANMNLMGLVPGSWDGVGPMPPVYDYCCNLLVVMIKELIPCLGRLVVFIPVVPLLDSFLWQIDLCLSTLLTILTLLIPHVVPVVGVLCFSVQDILQFLNFTHTLMCLGLSL